MFNREEWFMDVTHSFVYNMCVIELIKSTSTQTLKEFLEANDQETYLCLGHFDMMRTWRTSANSRPLETIQCNIQSKDKVPGGFLTENCRSPLYAIKQVKSNDRDTLNQLDQFWSMDCNFLFVTRFHCDRTESVSLPFSQALFERSRTLPTDGIISHLRFAKGLNAYTQYLPEHPDPSRPEIPVAAVVFYDSLELGDIVGIVKSNAISIAMGILQHLYACEAVSDAYTYCGVDRRLLGPGCFLPMPQNREMALSSRDLACTTTRFSIKMAIKADPLLQAFIKNGGRVGFITGTADVIVEWPSCTERELLSFISEIVHYDSLFDAFTDIITRIGIPYTTPQGSRKEPPALKKFPFTKMLPNGTNLSQVFTGPLERWRYPVSRMVSTLQAMYESSILDSLALLLLPGVDAFLARVHYLHEHNIWNDTYEEDISDFLDNWAALANDVSHLESQIVQHPELTPARYYIPAMVLQFERTLLMKYVSIMKRLDKWAAHPDSPVNSRDFAPILLPTAEESVYTLCPLDPEFDTQYTETSPLCIFLPIQRIYQPWDLAHMLCHEIQHYSGDALRCRENRLACLSRSAASYIVAFLSLLTIEPGSYHFSNLSKERAFQEEIANLIIQRLKYEGRLPYLKHIQDTLPGIMFDIVQRRETQERMQDILFHGMSLTDQMASVHWMCQLNTLECGVCFMQAFEAHTQYLCGLCKECYADIAMILTLDCSFEAYYSCMYGEEQLKYTMKPSSILDIQMTERHTDRLALVILTLKRFFPNFIDKPKHTHTGPWARIALDKVTHWESVRDDMDSPLYSWKRLYAEDAVQEFTLLADEAKELEAYLLQCANRLNAVLGKEKIALKDFRDHLKCVSNDCFDWDQARKYLEQV